MPWSHRAKRSFGTDAPIPDPCSPSRGVGGSERADRTCAKAEWCWGVWALGELDRSRCYQISPRPPRALAPGPLLVSSLRGTFARPARRDRSLQKRPWENNAVRRARPSQARDDRSGRRGAGRRATNNAMGQDPGSVSGAAWPQGHQTHAARDPRAKSGDCTRGRTNRPNAALPVICASSAVAAVCRAKCVISVQQISGIHRWNHPVPQRMPAPRADIRCGTRDIRRCVGRRRLLVAAAAGRSVRPSPCCADPVPCIIMENDCHAQNEERNEDTRSV